MSIDKEDIYQLWSLISFIRRSSTRRSIVLELSKKPRFPTELAKKLEIDISNISRNLKLLESKDIVSCYNPSDKKGKFYCLSYTGRQVLEKLESI